jgi:putative peptidoglycan lipid II flippase
MKVLLSASWRRWQSWSDRSANRRIFAAAITIGGAGLFVSLVSMIKDLVVAYRFGRGDELDAFLIAYLLPSFALTVVAGSFDSAFVPTFITTRDRHGGSAAQALFSSALGAVVVVLLLVTGVLAVATPYVLPVVASSFDSEKIALTQTFLFALLPMILLAGLATAWTSVLNAGRRFLVAALAPTVVPGVIIGLLLLSGTSLGITALVVGTLAGLLTQCAFLAILLRRHGIRLLPRWGGFSPELSLMVRQYGQVFAGALLMNSTGLVDQSMAAMLEPGSVAALSYGGKVVSFVLGLGGVAIGTAVLPHFSVMASEGAWASMSHTLSTYIRLIVVGGAVLALFLFLVSEPLTSLLFERGAFSSADAQVVSRVQAFYVLQLPWYFGGMLAVRLLSALRMNSVLTKVAAVNFVVNIALNLLFMRWLGVAGIALATAFVYLGSFLLCWYAVTRKLAALRSGNGAS